MQKDWADEAEDETNYSIYKDSLHAFNVELATARPTFFSNLINSNLNNTHTLFATVERLASGGAAEFSHLWISSAQNCAFYVFF